MPLSWGYIKASHYDAHSNLVAWQTLQEQNTESFTVERSDNGVSFQPIGNQPAAGNATVPSAYTFLDKMITGGKPVYYYRIRQRDIDGKSAYSSTVQVSGNHAAAGNEVIVAPNPAQGNQMQISTNGSSPVIATVMLTDLTGKVLMTKKCRLTNKGQLFLPEINSGIYLLSVNSEGHSSVRKIVIR